MKFSTRFFEFEDQAWLPSTIREGMTDYLRYVLSILNFYKPITPLIIEGLEKTSTNTITDLCSGSGGAIERVRTDLIGQINNPVQITLTDKYPNANAFVFIEKKTKGAISYSSSPVDATNVPNDLNGFRTIFSGFHHFDKEQARAVLKNAADSRSGIGIFDGGDQNIFTVICITLMHPIAFFILTPFFRPYRVSRFILTYLIPIIPLCTIWDGIVSILRLYSPGDLLEIANQVEDKGYLWRSGKLKSTWGMNVTYLIGYPSHH